jgi:hypothetical protein
MRHNTYHKSSVPLALCTMSETYTPTSTQHEPHWLIASAHAPLSTELALISSHPMQ